MPRLLAVIFAFLTLTISVSANAGFVERPAKTVAAAIKLTRPRLALKVRENWAKLLIETARKNDFDPFTGVAIIRSESRWNPSVVSRDGEDFGLGQVRARYIKGCNPDIPAARDNSKSCNAVKARLLSSAYGIRRMGAAITAWRKKCRKVTGRPALFKRWLHGYGGMGKRKGRRWIRLCNQRPTKKGWVDLGSGKRGTKQRRNHVLLMRIINHRLDLIRKFKPRRKRKRRSRT